MAIIDHFDRGWSINPDGIAYIQDERSFTFTEAGELSCQVAHALLAGGYAAGTKGAVWSNNDVTSWICTLGRWRAGRLSVGCSCSVMASTDAGSVGSRYAGCRL